MSKRPNVYGLIAAWLLIQIAFTLPARAEGEIPYQLKNVCLNHPEPAWWSLGRRGMHGKVVCQLKINPKNGEVDEVKILKRSRFQELDAACVLCAFKWKFKPGTITSATIPFELILKGYFKEIH
jgi:TonB family protein